MDKDFIYEEDVKSWADKYGYSIYINIFGRFGVERIQNGKKVPCYFDLELTQENISSLIKESVKKDTDLINQHVLESEQDEFSLI